MGIDDAMRQSVPTRFGLYAKHVQMISPPFTPVKFFCYEPCRI